jgi:hypothetical protein
MAVLMLACVGHVGLIALLAGGLGTVRLRLPPLEAEPLRVLLLEPVVRPEPPAPADVPAPRLAPPSEVFAGPPPEIGPSDTALSPPVSDSVPLVDWIDERRREVANVAARQCHYTTKLPTTPNCNRKL